MKYPTWCARRRFWWAIRVATLGSVAITVAWLWAHEGHAPLPTKGAQVDVAKGIVVLSRDARDALDLRTEEAVVQPAEERVLAYATLAPTWEKHAYVTSRLPGRITQLPVTVGQVVTKGQVLAEVQSVELENLQLEVTTARTNVDLSSKILAQREAGSAAGSISEKEVQEARSKHRENQNALEIARSKRLSLGLSSSQFESLLHTSEHRPVPSLAIHSPIDGVVIHSDLTVGKIVDPIEHLFEVVDLSSLWVRIDILENDLPQIEIGSRVDLRLTARPDVTIRTSVAAKSQFVHPQTHLGTVWADLANTDNQTGMLFLPGMHGLAHVVTRSSGGKVTVPASALISDGAERFVFVEESSTAKATELRRRNVITGIQSLGFTQIEGGIYPGDKVVTQGSHQLAPFFAKGVLRLSAEARRNIVLETEAIGLHVVEDVFELEAAVDVLPDHRAAAASPLKGTIHRLSVKRGAQVQAGDVLAEVASLELQDVQLDLLRTHLQAELLVDLLKRFRGAESAVPRRQLWDTEAQYDAARLRQQSLERKLETLGLSREQVRTLLADKKLVEALPIRAPISGTVVNFEKVLGQAINADESLFEIHDLSHAWVQGLVSERDMHRVQLGQRSRVRIASDPHQVANGKIARSGWTVGAENRTLSVWIELDQAPSRMLPHNTLARITLVAGKSAPVLAVPRGAIVTEGLRAFVFVEQQDGAFARVAVETGRMDDRRVEIISGLRAGNVVAVRGTAELQTAYAALR